MNKILIIALISLSFALACHPSCNCNEGSNVCQSCKVEGSERDSHKRSCPCPAGFYTSSLYPTFACTKLINSNPDAVVMDACQLDIGLKTKNIDIDTYCHFENVEGKTYVLSQVSLNLNKISLSQTCQDAYVTSVQWKDPNVGVDGEWKDWSSSYVTSVPNGGSERPEDACTPGTPCPLNPIASKIITIPLIEVYNFASTHNLGTNQITQVIHLRVKIGHEDKYVRYHKWDLTVYTNRDQVQVFNIDVDVQETDGCQPGQECIVIADLDTVGKVMLDSGFVANKPTPYKYKVGDNFYAKITFADPTYTKRLQFDSLYFKTDRDDGNKVFDFTSIAVSKWDGTGLCVTLPLVEPTINAAIQINMRITDESALRALQSGGQGTTSVQLSAQVFSKSTTVSNSQDTSNNNTSTYGLAIVFALINLFAFIL